MVSSEQEMVRKLIDDAATTERSTSLQPTYEDSVPPEDAWDGDEEYGS